MLKPAFEIRMVKEHLDLALALLQAAQDPALEEAQTFDHARQGQWSHDEDGRFDEREECDEQKNRMP